MHVLVFMPPAGPPKIPHDRFTPTTPNHITMASTSAATDDWTFVKPKSRKNGKKQPVKPLPGAQTDATTPSKPRTTGLRSVEEIEREYETVKQRWEETGSAEKLRGAMKTERARIGKAKISSAVCFGLGTFDPEDGAWGQKRMSFIQLAAFLVMVDELSMSLLFHRRCSDRHIILTSSVEKGTDDTIQCVFQDPICTQSDKDFLSKMGHKAVDAPAGIDSIDEDCFFYAVHLYRPVYAAVVQKALPKIFVGTDFAEWEK